MVIQRAGELNLLRAKGLRLAGWAAAQLALIVIGVSIALWADSWMASRQDRQIEAARLAGLEENVNRTLAQLRVHAGGIREIRTALFALLNRPESNLLPDTDHLERMITLGFLSIPTFSPELNLYEDLKNSGELGLLKDPEVRASLSAMDAALQRVRDARDDLTSYQQLIDTYMIRQLDLVSLLEGHLGLEADWVGPGTEAYADIVAEREFRNLVVFKLDLLGELDRVSDDLETTLIDAQAAISRRLEQLR